MAYEIEISISGDGRRGGLSGSVKTDKGMTRVAPDATVDESSFLKG